MNESGFEKTEASGLEIKKSLLAEIRSNDYKNSELFDLEPEYLKNSDYKKENFAPHQWRRKITELALRLGRNVKKGPMPMGGNEAIDIFKELVGDISEADQKVVFYEDDHSKQVKFEPISDKDFDYSALLENAVDSIELKGVNMQQKKEDLLLAEGKFISEDKSRVREISLKNKKDNQLVPVVAKRIRLNRVRRSPFEELEIMSKAIALGLPAPEPIAKLEAGGNFYILMEKVSGFNFKNILKTPILLKEIMGEENFDSSKIELYLGDIKKKIAELEIGYQEAGINRRDFSKDTQDLMISFERSKKEFIVVPIDFEKVKT